MNLQKQYCENKGIPMFAPLDGVCFHCGKTIRDTANKHITGCEHCNHSYCD